MTPIALKSIPDNVRKFLMLITYTEGTDLQKTPYNELFGLSNFKGYETHPNILIVSHNYRSTAAGRYQFLYRTWLGLKKKFPDATFSPEWQDLLAIELLRQCKAYDYIIKGDWKNAIDKANVVWASLPGSPYGQPTKPLNACLKFLKTA